MTEAKKAAAKRRKKKRRVVYGKREEVARKAYEAVLAVVRREGRFIGASEIAREIGIHRTTVTKAWTEGWVDLDLPPISDVTILDAAAARVRLREIADEPLDAAISGVDLAQIDAAVQIELERAKQRAAVAEARAEEGRGVAATRRNALTLAAAVASLSRSMLILAPRLDTAIAKEAEDLSSREILNLMRTAARVTKESAEAMHRAIVLERLTLGEPTSIEKVLVEGEMSEEQALAWLRRGAELVQRHATFKKWGDLRVIEGGRPDTDADADAG